MAFFLGHQWQSILVQLPFITFAIIIRIIWLIPSSESAILSSSINLPGSPNCDAKNRDPCTTFPGLCSTGGGLCVLKGPCEYECVCPPDGRRGRDCTGSEDIVSSPRDEVLENPNGGSLLDSLLVFPQDLFWDLNHVLRPEESVKMMQSTPPHYYDSGPSTTPATSSFNQLNSTQNDTIPETQSYHADNNGTSNILATNTTQNTDQQQNSNDLSNYNVNDAVQIITTQPTLLTTRTIETTSKKTNVETTTSSTLSMLSPSTTKAVHHIANTNSKANSFSVKKILSISDVHSQITRGNTENQSLEKPSNTTGENNQSPTTRIPIKINNTRMISTEIKVTLPTTQSTTTSPVFTSSHKLPIQDIPTGSLLPMIERSTTFVQQSSPPSLTSLLNKSYGTTIPTPTSQTRSNHNIIDILRLLGSTPQSVTLSNPVNLRNSNLGHESFPTFFRDVINDKAKDDGPPNMAVSKRVHRVFFPIAQFGKIQRRRKTGGD